HCIADVETCDQETEDMGVKASGAVRDRATAETMIKAGATRIGTSSGVAIVSGQQASASSY
ncbi:hypothetical protein GCT62_24935, partial [Yersinia enterocolitica]|nr:hypothetical protein [Yersinia enterocolitica]